MRPIKLLTTLTLTLVMAEAAYSQSPLYRNKLNHLRSRNNRSENLITQTNTSIDNLSALEQAVIQEMNRVRSNPHSYADELMELKQYYDGNQLKIPGREPVTTVEGVAAVNDAIKFLRSTSPLPPLTASLGMSIAAKDHVQDQGPAGQTGHTGTDGSDPYQRISRYGTAQTSVAESIAYGEATAEEVVRSLIIDDGLESRGHRMAFFAPYFKFTGVACGEHTRRESMCVITYAREFTDSENLAQIIASENSEQENRETTATEPETESETAENSEATAENSETTAMETEAETTENSETTAMETESETTENAETTTENPETTATETEAETTANPETTATETEPDNTIAINSSNLISLPFSQNGALETGDSQLPNDSSFYDMYAFKGSAGQSVTISVESQEFDTYLFLLDPENEQIAENDDISESNKNSAITITLPASGTYRVIVNSYDSEGKGNYSLSVSQ